jgi:hypothetical protein
LWPLGAETTVVLAEAVLIVIGTGIGLAVAGLAMNQLLRVLLRTEQRIASPALDQEGILAHERAEESMNRSGLAITR